MYDDDHSLCSFNNWLNGKSDGNEMFSYWELIFDFQVLILQFIRAQRERNFLLYVHALRSCMKYIFSLNHYNYARWLSVHVNDLMRLPITNRRLYEEFLAGNFVFQKSNNSFSAMALDQAHEQNNAVIKGAGGVIGLLTPDMEPALRRWEIAAPDVGRLIAEYEHLALD